MKKLNNKGFTIVELVIVVAVIAILAAVLIPTMSNLIKTAQTSADVTLVKNVNLFLATERAAEGKNATMQDALDDALEGGYDISKLTPTNSDNLILWDQESDNFVLYANGKYNNAGADVKVTDEYKLWNIYTEMPETQTYSIYWNGGDIEEANVSVGFDAGNSKVASINYSSISAKSVIIRTNGGNLTINDTNSDSEQIHYGYANVTSVSTGVSCYYEHGEVSILIAKEGKVVLESDSVVSTVGKIGSTEIVKKEGTTVFNEVNDKTEEELKAIKYGGGNGTKEEPYLIYTATQLSSIIADKGSYFKLGANIDLNGISNWTPIGSESNEFYGHFDGNNKEIRNLTINANAGASYGLFGIVKTGENNVSIVNVKIVGADIYAPVSEMVGALIGQAVDAGGTLDVSGCYVDSTTKIVAGDKVGGLIGKLTQSGYNGSPKAISNVTVEADVTAVYEDARVGGFIGQHSVKATNDYKFDSCIFAGKVSGKMAGGFVGHKNNACAYELVNCKINGKLNGTERYADVVAYAQGSTKIMLSNCSKNNSAIVDVYEGMYYSDTTKKDTTVSIVIKDLNDIKAEYFMRFTQNANTYSLSFSGSTELNSSIVYPDGTLREIADAKWDSLGSLINTGNAELTLSIDTLYKIVSE